ncbi:cytochrome P450 [Schizophyllum fasciatum]
MDPTRDSTIALGAVAVVACIAIRAATKPSPPLPPGPPKSPIIGNIMYLATDKGWEAFHQWSKELDSELISLTGCGKTVVITNSFASTKGVFERTSAGDRPQLMTLNELVGWKNSVIFSAFNDNWKRQRRQLHQIIGTRASSTRYDHMKEAAAAKFVLGLVEEPERLEEHCHTFAGDLILRMTYGYFSKGYDPMIKMAEEITDGVSDFGAPGKWMVDIFPWLRLIPSWVPGTGWQQVVKERRDDLRKLVNEPYEWVQKEMDAGRAAPSFVSELLSEKGHSPDDIFSMKWSAGSLFAGGSHTTTWTIYAFMKMMCVHPEIQARAQAEVDRVIGRDRLPRVADREDCPYICACIAETLRWHVVLPQAVPHQAMDDIIYGDYVIPKGSIILPNLWALSRDEKEYPEPHTFNPERYLGENPQRSPLDWVFGFGRRVCPGRLMAQESMFVVCASTLATMNISRKTKDGIPVPIDLTQTAGLASRPTYFEYDVKPRNGQVRSLVDDALLAQ